MRKISLIILVFLSATFIMISIYSKRITYISNQLKENRSALIEYYKVIIEILDAFEENEINEIELETEKILVKKQNLAFDKLIKLLGIDLVNPITGLSDIHRLNDLFQKITEEEKTIHNLLEKEEDKLRKFKDTLKWLWMALLAINLINSIYIIKTRKKIRKV